jgi:hypothetical protein
MKWISFSFMLFSLGYTEAQDTTFVRTYLQGSAVQVPLDKSWTIEKAYITQNDGYNIVISLSNFDKIYPSESKLSLPYYCAEMELISGTSSIFYILTIKEKPIH